MVHGFSKEKPPTGLTPDFGAIFMSSKLTKKECLRKKLFGLPSAFNSFIKHVKAGMLLFLFEYESRQLHGVFEATSDGDIDIMPNAYKSSGKKFPAQVKVKIVWNCQPLMEHDFFDAIKDNYFQATKFNFGLSKDQVYHLLLLFHQNRDWTEEPCIFSTQHVYQEEITDDLYLDDHEPAGCKRTEHPTSNVCTHCNQDSLFTRSEDPIVRSQLILPLGAPVTKKTNVVSYYQPYDPDKPYFHSFPTCAETGVKSFMSEPGSCSRSWFEGQSEEIHTRAENVDSFIDSIQKDLELGDFISLDSPSCTGGHRTKYSNPDCNQAASLSSTPYGYPETFDNCRFYSHHVREKVASSSRSHEDGEFIYEATDRGTTVGTRSKKLSVFEQPDGLFFGNHTQIGCTKNLKLGDFIPPDLFPCIERYHPTTRISTPDRGQATCLSSRHFGYPERSHNCRISEHYFREKVESTSQNDVHEDLICEANDVGSKVGTRSQKRVSVFSRLSFAPKDSRESNNGSPSDSTVEIMQRLQKKHDNWSKKLTRINFKGREGSSSQKRRVILSPKLRLTSSPIQRDAKGAIRKDLLVAKRMNENVTITENVEAPPINPECSSTQKQNKRRKLIRPNFGFRPLGRECVTFPYPDSQLPHQEDEASKVETESFVGVAESVCISENELAAESLSLAAEGKVSRTFCAEASDENEMASKKALREVPVEAQSNVCLLSFDSETEVVRCVDLD